MKRGIALLLTVFMAVSLAACGKSETAGGEQETKNVESSENTEGTDEAAEKPYAGTTLTYMASQDWIYDSEYEIAEQFEEETGIHIDFQIVPADQYSSLLLTKLNSGECTDLFGNQSGKFDLVSELNITENAVPLTN